MKPEFRCTNDACKTRRILTKKEHADFFDPKKKSPRCKRCGAHGSVRDNSSLILERMLGFR